MTDLAKELALTVVADGEGATKTIEVTVTGAQNEGQAKRVAKAIANSPLVKTAVHGADPNWGRVAMAIGKCEEQKDISPDRVTIAFGDMEVFPAKVFAPEAQARLEALMANDLVPISVDLGLGQASTTVWGCDLSAEYIRINAEYTT